MRHEREQRRKLSDSKKKKIFKRRLKHTITRDCRSLLAYSNAYQ